MGIFLVSWMGKTNTYKVNVKKMHHGDATISPNMVESPKFHVVYYNANHIQKVVAGLNGHFSEGW